MGVGPSYDRRADRWDSWLSTHRQGTGDKIYTERNGRHYTHERTLSLFRWTGRHVTLSMTLTHLFRNGVLKVTSLQLSQLNVRLCHVRVLEIATIECCTVEFK